MAMIINLLVMKQRYAGNLENFKHCITKIGSLIGNVGFQKGGL